jgi:putative Holliday junction resolvase
METAPATALPHQTVIAFDFGTLNIGVAVGNSRSQSSQALNPIKARDGIPSWDQMAQLFEEWQPDLIVVGLPLNMDGSASDMSRRANKFANRIHGRFGLPCSTLDERLTTFEAKQHARAQGHKGNYREKPIDSVAAELILEDWWRSAAAPPKNEG